MPPLLATALLATTATLTPPVWPPLAPAVRDALECRQHLPTGALQALPQLAPGHWSFTPPERLQVFGLPVQQVDVFIDPEDAQTARYEATLASANLESLALLLSMAGRGPLIGQLSAKAGPAGLPQVVVRCRSRRAQAVSAGKGSTV